MFRLKRMSGLREVQADIKRNCDWSHSASFLNAVEAIGHGISCLEQIGQLQGGFGGTEQFSRSEVGKAVNITRHMCLISVAGVHGKICQALLGAHLARGLEKTLETQHRLKHLWTVANGGRKPPMKLTFADPNRVTQLSDTAFGMA